jgi:hypothetical protein
MKRRRLSSVRLSGRQAAFTNWSFEQLAGIAGAPPKYLRSRAAARGPAVEFAPAVSGRPDRVGVQAEFLSAANKTVTEGSCAEVSFCECATGTRPEVAFESYGLFFRWEVDRYDDGPRTVRNGPATRSVVVPFQAAVYVARDPNIVMSGI